MENLPSKAGGVGVSIYDPKPGTKAVDLRRKMAQLPEVAKALGEIDRFVFIASTKTLIGDIDDVTLVSKTKTMFRFIAIDVGCKMPVESEDWSYTCTRLYTILKRYYSKMSLADVKLAFELAVTGELDEFLPRLSNGQADKNHYQQFNAEYFGKILNAYKAKRQSVFNKAVKALPPPEKNTTPEEVERLIKNHNYTVESCKNAFLKYKYYGVFELTGLQSMFIYDWLFNVGLSGALNATKEDREKALRVYIKRIDSGIGNKWDAAKARKDGPESSKIDFTVYEIVREKEILRVFNGMIEDSVIVNDFLNYK